MGPRVTRIIAGLARGRQLRVPPTGTRPTSDRAREALFSSLGDVTGLRVLDLYAGSGAVGLEALSRGAAVVTLVEQDRRAAEVVAANVAVVRLPGAVLRREAVESLLAGPNPAEPYDLVFADPPYALTDAVLAAVLIDARANRWYAENAVVVVERSARTSWSWPEGLVADRERRYGEATLWYGRAAR
jgi:16S rRNA (guanine966-N2)-methyltransferase